MGAADPFAGGCGRPVRRWVRQTRSQVQAASPVSHMHVRVRVWVRVRVRQRTTPENVTGTAVGKNKNN